MKTPFIPAALCAIVLACLAPLSARAASLYWDGNGSAAGAGSAPGGSWGADNWWNSNSGGTGSPGAWNSGDAAIFSAGTDATGTYTVSLSGAQTAGGVTFEEGTVTLSGSGLTLSVATVTVNSGAKGIISSVISGTLGLTKAGGSLAVGAGELVLEGANDFSGNLTLQKGTLTLDNDSAASSGTINISNGGGSGGAVTLRSTKSLTTLANAISLGSANANNIDFAADTGKQLVLNGVISGSHFLRGNGAGTIVLGGLSANTFGSALTIVQGTVVAAKDQALGTAGASTVVNSGATLGFQGDIWYQTGETVTLNGTGVGSAGAINNLSGDNAFDGYVALASASSIGTAANSSLTLAYPITGGYALTKVGAGILDLFGENSTYTTTLVSEGILGVWSTGETGTGLVTVNAIARLEGNGSVPGGVALTGTISPGISPGTLNTGSQTWNGGATYEWEVNDATGTAGADPGWDLLNITGGLTINATTGSKFTVKIYSLDPLDNQQGNADNFSNTTEQNWTIAATTTGIPSFDADNFTLDDSGFSNAKGGGRFVILTSGNNLVLRFDPPPVLDPCNNIVQANDTGNCSASVAFAATATDNQPGTTFTYKIGSTPITSPHLFPLGLTTVDVTATDSVGNTDTCSFTITVNDTELPVPVCKNISVQLDAQGRASIVPADVYQSGGDNCGTVNLVSVVPDSFTYCNLGANSVTLTVNDDHGNIGTCNATVTITAPAAPPAVVYVDDDYGTSCAEVTFPASGGSGQYYIGYNAFKTIQGAVTAVAAAGTVNVAPGSYTELVSVPKPLQLLNHTPLGAVITAPASADKAALVTVDASNVTIDGFKFQVNQPDATAGVFMDSTLADPDTELTVQNCWFEISGAFVSGGADAYIGFGTYSTAIAVNGTGGFPTVHINGNQIQPDSVTTPTAMFDRAIFLREGNGNISGNTVYGDAHDLAAQFVSNGSLTINGNFFLGKGGRDTKGAQVDFTEPNSSGSIFFSGNTITPFGPATPSGSTHVRSLMIKNNAQGASVTIVNNTFTDVQEVAILAGNSKSTTIQGNTFTPLAGDSSFVHVQISNKVPTGGAPAAVQMNATIQANTFGDSTVAGGRGIEFLNHNSAGATFGTIILGGGGLPNTFEAGLDRFIHLDDEIQANSQSSSRPYYSAYGATVMAKFPANLDATGNLFDVGAGPADPATMAPTSLFALEDKVFHAPDVAGLGLVRVKAANVYVTTASGSIQRGIDAATAGDTVNVNLGTYRERVILNKSITVSGDRGDVNVAGPGPNAPTLDGDLDNNGSPDMGDGFTIPRNTSLSGITVEGFIIQNFANGGGGNGVGVGVISWENTSSHVTIRDNRFVNLGYNGVYVGTDSDDMQSYWLIQRNIVEGAPYAGIELTDVSNSQVLDNVITAPSAIFDDPGDAGVGIEIAARARVGTVTTGPVLVQGNTISGAFASGSRAGINLLARAYNSGSADARLSGITVQGNEVTGSGTRGIDVVAESRNGKPSRIENLTIANNTLSGNATGIQVGDTFTAPKANGTYDVATITIQKNNLELNTAFGLNNLATPTVVAANNWWGDVSGPVNGLNPGALGVAAAGNIIFSPWLGDGTDTQPTVVGFQPNAAPVYYQPDHVVFFTQPGGAGINSPLAPQPVVRVIDSNGGLDTVFNGSVTVAINSGTPGATLSGGLFTVPVVGGVAAFSGLQIDRAGSYTLIASSASPILPATSASFDISNPMPSVTDINPTWAVAGDPDFTLTVNGANFVYDSVVRWNGSGRATTYSSPSQVTATITAADIASAGTANVTVFNDSPGGGESAPAVSFEIKPAVFITYVDDAYVGKSVGDMVNWPDDGNPGPHMIGYDAFATIQGGVTRVAVTGRVNVAAGNYPEAVQVAKAVTIAGAGQGVSVLAPPPSPSNGTLATGFVLDGASNVEIFGFTVQGDGTGDDNNAGSNQRGVRIYNYDGFADGVTSAHINVHDCTFTALRIGAIFRGSVSDLKVQHCVFDGIRAYFTIAVGYTGTVGGYTMQDLQFTDNEIKNCTGLPIGVHNYSYAVAPPSVIQRVTISRNKLHDNSTAYPIDNEHGAIVSRHGVVDFTITDNEIWNNFNMSGINITGPDSAASHYDHLVITGNKIGIHTGYDRQLSGSNFDTTSPARGIKLGKASGNELRKPANSYSFYNNSIAVTDPLNPAAANKDLYWPSWKDSTDKLNASGNWWGSVAEADVAAEIVSTTGVDFTPYLHTGDDTASGTVGFQGDFSALNVTTLGQQTGTTGRIQEGVDMVSGSTVYVNAGTYAENVVLNKRVQLIGAQNPWFAPDTFIDTSTIGGNAITITADGSPGIGNAQEVQNIHCQGKGVGAGNDYGINVTVAAYYLNLYNVYADNYTLAGLIFNGTYDAGTPASINIWDCQFQACDLGINLGLGMNGIDIRRGLIKNNRFSGLITAGNDSQILDNIHIDGTQFVDNGTGGLALSTYASDIFLQRFNGSGLLENLTFNTYAATALDLRGRGPLHAPTAAAGTVQIKNCVFTGSALDGNAYNKDLIKIRNYTAISGISFNGVTLNTRNDAAATGLRFEDITGTANYVLAGVSFPNANSGYGNGYDILNATAMNIDATAGVSFGGADNFTIEDRVLHKIDVSALGLVTWVANNDYVTPNSFAAPATTAASIQRGVDALSSGTVNVQAGTYAGNVVVNKNLVLSPGASPALVTVTGNLTLGGGDTLVAELEGAGPGTGYDQWVVNGSVNLGGATLYATSTFAYPAGATVVLIANDGTDPVSGTFNGLPNGAPVTIGPNSFTIYYNGGDGNDVVLFRSGGLGSFAEVWVDDNFPNPVPGQDPDAGGPAHYFMYDSFPTVQGGVNAVTAGGTVNVAAGTYPENVIANKAVTLKGANFGVAGCGSRGSPSAITSAGGVAFTITAVGVVVDGMDILGGTTGVLAHTVEGFSLRNNVVNGVKYGMDIQGVVGTVAPAFTVENNQVVAGPDAGSDPADGTAGILLAGISGTAPIIQGNCVAGAPSATAGYFLYQVGTSPVLSIQGGTIKTVMQGVSVVNVNPVTGTGFYPSTFVVDGLTMSDFAGSSLNTLRKAQAGVMVLTMGSVATDRITGTIKNVDIQGVDKLSAASAGIFLRDLSTGVGTRQAFTIQDSVISNNKNRGVFAQGANAEVTVTRCQINGNGGDPFTGNGYGVRASDNAKLVLSESFVTNPGSVTSGTPRALYASGGATLTASKNSVTATIGKLAENGSATLNASGNWWGDTEDTTIAGLMQGDVDFTPYLDAGGDTAGSTPGFQGSFSTLHITMLGVQTGSTGRLQEGNDLVSGSTVIVENGLYKESNTTITKPLLLIGESRTGAIIAPAAEDANVNSSFGAPYQYALLLQSGDVTIQRLTIDGEANPGLTAGKNNFRGGVMTDHRIATMMNNITVEDVTVQHTYRRGIQVFSGVSSKSTGHVITGNSVTDVTVGPGIAVYDSDVAVTANSIQDVPDGSGIEVVQNMVADMIPVIQGNTLGNVYTGIQVVRPAEGSVIGGPNPADGNTITLSGAADDIGIIVRNCTGTVTVQNNQVTGSAKDAGIWIYATGDAAHPVLVKNNVLITTGRTPDYVGTAAGIFMTDERDYYPPAAPDLAAYAIISGNTVTGFEQGIYLWRSGSNPVGGQVVQATIGGDNPADANTITGCGTGVLVFDADGAANGYRALATLKNNAASIKANAIGIDVNGGAALIENNNLTGNTVAAIRAQNGAVVDAGQCPGSLTDVTGLGISTGGNILTGYGFDAAAPWAIENLNSGTPVVLAYQNNYGAVAGDNVVTLMSGPVAFSQAGGALVTCPAPVTVECPGNIPAAATDLAGFLAQGGTVSCSPATVSALDTTHPASDGSVTRTYTITDVCGAVATCTQIITVDDTQVPTLALTPPAAANADGNCQAPVPAVVYTAGDNCGSPTVVQTPAAGTLVGIGTYTITVVATDASGLSTTETTSFVVNDTTPPVITVLGDNPMLVECHTPFVDPGFTAVDNCVSAPAPTTFDGFTTGSSVNYQGSGGTRTYASVPPGAGIYTVPDPYGSLWTVADEWGFMKAPPGYDEQVVDDGTGNKVWRLSNARTGSFSDQPNSPNAPQAAGESTSFLWNDRGPNHTTPVIAQRAPATTRYFHGSFKFKSATGAAQAGLQLNISPTARQSDRRNSFVRLIDSGAGFNLQFIDTGIGGSFPGVEPVIASGLSYTAWHKIDVYIQFVDGLNGDGSGNDIVTVRVNDVTVHVGTTWETYYQVATPTRPVGAVDALMFRSSTAAPATLGNGFFFDDVVVDNARLSDLLILATTGTVDSNTPGDYTLTYTATDPSGNIGTATRTVTVQDTTPPSITTCAPSQVLPAGAACTAILPDLTGLVVASDTCDAAVVVTQDPEDGTVIPIGPTLVTLTVTDDAGLTATCQATVTVTDQTPPSLTLTPPANASADVNCQAAVPTVAYIVADNCDASPSVVQTPSAGTLVGLGTHTITVVATDAGGNATTQTTSFVVNDTTPPVITVLGANPMFVECHTAFTDPGATAVDNCAGVAESPSGTQLYFNGFEADINGWFTPTRVASGTGGVPSASGGYHATTAAGAGDYTRWGGYNYGAGGGVPTVFREYKTTVKIHLDVAGGWANNTRFDFSSAINNNSGNHKKDFIFNAGFYNDSDGSPGSGTLRFVISASNNSQPGSAYAKNPARFPIAISTTGWYTFQHHFYDNAGVLAVDMSIYDSSGTLVNTWTLSDPADLITGVGGNRYGWFDYNQFPALAFDDSELWLAPGPYVLTTTGTVDPNTPGDYTLTYTATDPNGNTGTATRTVTVQDTTPPSITTCAPSQVLPAGAACTAILPDLTGLVVASDTCDAAVVVTQDPAAGTVIPIGPTLVTLTVTDDAGLTATCQATVTVTDQTAPLIVCPADVSVDKLADTGPHATGYATATDNCTPTGSIAITYTDDRSGLTGCGATGTIKRTWTAKDAANNTSTCDQTITVTDSVGPVLTGCPADITVDNDLGLCGAVVTWTDPTAKDLVHFQGFEEPDWVSGPWETSPSVDWNEYNSAVSRVPTGTDGITSKTGLAHAVVDAYAVPPVPDDYTGIFSRLGGYSSTFGTGFRVAQDVYFDLDDPAVTANTYGWDASAAASTQAGGHLRDFIFHTASDASGKILVAASNGSNFTRRNDLASLNHYTVTATGWYTLEWIFRDNGSGALAVDCNLRDAAGTLLWTETRSDPSDLIATVVGGNRYLWFTFFEVASLAIDNTTLERNAPVTCSPASGTFFAVGTSTVTCTGTDACGNPTTCSFNVTVQDAEDPIIICPADLVVSTDAGDCAAVVYNIEPVDFDDNCTVDTVKYTLAGDTTGGGDDDASGEAFNKGVTTVTYTVTDIHGNTASCSFTVTVEDNEAPLIAACATPKTVSADSACQGAIPDLTAEVRANATDNCTPSGSLTITQDPLAGTMRGLGIWTVTLTVKDASGNPKTCSATVTVADTTPPVLTGCPTPFLQVRCADPMPDPATVTANDNCDGVVAVSFAESTTGSDCTLTLARTWTAIDSHGNAVTCVQVITRVKAPTAAELDYFRATSAGERRVALGWRTLVEVEALGFHLDRQTTEGQWERITPGLIPAQGQNEPFHVYRFQDSNVSKRAGLRYRLVEVNVRAQERVLGEAVLNEAPTLTVTQQADGIALHMQGEARGTVVLQTSPNAVNEPWTRAESIQLDETGAATVVRPIDPARPMQFYRLLVE